MKKIIKKLKGEDLRSIGKVQEVVLEILENPSLFDEVFRGIVYNDPVVRMRASDAIEKVSRLHPEYLAPYKYELIKELSRIEQQEVRWHVAQMFSYLELEEVERKEIIELLASWLDSEKSKIVKVNSMQTLASFAEKDDKNRPFIIQKIKEAMDDGSPALINRGNKLLSKLRSKR